MISITVPGNPIPKQRPRIGKGDAYTPKRTLEYEKKVALAAKEKIRGDILIGDVSVSILFYRGDRRKCDIDNLQKTILDALNSIVYRDNSQIVSLKSEKHFDKKYPCAHIEIEDFA